MQEWVGRFFIIFKHFFSTVLDRLLFIINFELFFFLLQGTFMAKYNYSAVSHQNSREMSKVEPPYCMQMDGCHAHRIVSY